jgi:CDP-glucose 4,6-dehydratase
MEGLVPMRNPKPAATGGFWKGKGVLVTGATGVVGSWLVKDLLAHGARVVALVMDADPQSELIRSGDLKRISVVNGPLESLAAVERAVNLHETDTVFHLGAQTIVGVARRYPLATFEANIRGTYNLLEVCRLHASLVKRVVIASSDKAYGASRILPYVETMPLNGREPYEVSKSCSDMLGQSYASTYGLPVGIARCGNIYGGGDLNWSRIVPATIRALQRGVRPVIRSDGTCVRDYLYVKDAAMGYRVLAERLGDTRVRGEAFNFSAGERLTVAGLAKVLQKLMDAGSVKLDIRDTARGEIQDQYLSSAKARRLLGWRPAYGLEAGLRETIAWYRGYLATDES